MDGIAQQDIAPKKLGPTAYAVLGLLALRDWTTYELAQQMERGVGRMWAASPSMLYEEPKHLVARGYATVCQSPVGRRPRARYSITDAGRQALSLWLAEQPTPPALQFEGLIKVLFADHGPPGTNEAILAEIAAWARQSRTEAQARARGYLDGNYIDGVDLAARAAIVAQTLAFLAELYDLVERWTAWAAELAVAPDPADRAQQAFTAIADGHRALP